jgi:hypothetical protein
MVEERESRVQARGEERRTGTALLEAGARALQDLTPPRQFDVYVVGFHPMKDDPARMQMEAHHYCKVVNEDFIQAVIFDGNAADAKLVGIEYMISERAHATLPAEERRFWHPHNYEIFSGELVAPGLPAAAEKALMRRMMNSYGKTWHLWNAGMFGVAGDDLPLGEPMLAWSFNHDGEAMPGLVEGRDRDLGIDAAELRRERADLLPLARPQSGVDALRESFPAARPIPGVVDAEAAAEARRGR